MDLRVFILALMRKGQSWRNAVDQGVGGRWCEQGLLVGIFFLTFLLCFGV